MAAMAGWVNDLGRKRPVDIQIDCGGRISEGSSASAKKTSIDPNPQVDPRSPIVIHRLHPAETQRVLGEAGGIRVLGVLTA